MVDLVPYAPSYSFSGWQTSNPTKPLPAGSVDGEFANISLSVSRLLAGLTEVRRDDGKLANKLVTLDSLADEVRVPWTGGAVAAWATPVPYATGIAASADAPATTVVYSGSSYVCLTSHTTGALFDTGKWRLIASKGDNGAGTGDMLAANNLSDILDKPQALNNLNAFSRAGGTLTGATTIPNGTADAPPINFAGATTSGLYRLGTNGIGVSINGLRKLGVLDDGSLRGATDGTYLWAQLGASADIVALLTAANAAAGLTALGGVTTSAMNTAILAAVPAALGGLWWGSTPPAGYLEANGATLSRSVYSVLFNAANAAGMIGTSFGVGDGSTTFTLPDMRGVVPRGWDHGRGYDSGRTLGSYQADMVGPHNHSVDYGGTLVFTPGGSSVTRVSGSSATGTNSGTETRMKNLAVMFIVKYL